MSRTEKLWIIAAALALSAALLLGIKYADGHAPRAYALGGSPTPVWDLPEETAQPVIITDLPSTGSGSTLAA